MIEIISYDTYEYEDYQVAVNITHGKYKLYVFNDGCIAIYNGKYYATCKEDPNLHKEYEDFLKLDLELHKIYQGEEL